MAGVIKSIILIKEQEQIKQKKDLRKLNFAQLHFRSSNLNKYLLPNRTAA
jgi:hypothetical protein